MPNVGKSYAINTLKDPVDFTGFLTCLLYCSTIQHVQEALTFTIQQNKQKRFKKFNASHFKTQAELKLFSSNTLITAE